MGTNNAFDNKSATSKNEWHSWRIHSYVHRMSNKFNRLISDFDNFYTDGNYSNKNITFQRFCYLFLNQNGIKTNHRH